jgi:hypothetical protein
VLEIRNQARIENAILTSVDGLPLAIDKEDAEFLQGTTLEFHSDIPGFRFRTPQENASLLSKDKDDAKQAKRPELSSEQMEAAKEIDPARAVAEFEDSSPGY